MSDARKVLVEFPDEANYVVLPDGFPHEIWSDAAEWAETMALTVFYNDPRLDGSEPDPAWTRYATAVIAEGQRALTGGSDQEKLLLFYDVDKAPIPVSMRYTEVGASWDDVLPLYVGRYDSENVNEPTVEAFEMDDVEVAVRALRHTVLDPDVSSILLRVIYVWRRDGLDYQLQAAFPEMSAVRDALPVLEALVRGTVTTVVE